MTDWWRQPARLTVERNIPFSVADGEELVLDVFRPQTDETRPGMVAIVGGGWRQCHKCNFETLSIAMATLGYVTANVSYRVAPEHRWPRCIRDVKTAVRWFRSHATDYGLDPTRLGALGSSAGGHLAAMLAVTPADEQFGGTEYADQPSKVQAAVCLCTPADMAAVHEWHKEDKVTVNLLGGTPEQVPEVYREASPMTYVSADSAPCMFIHGEADSVVPIGPARAMSQRLRELGVDSPFIPLPGINHGARPYVTGARADSPMPQIASFLAEHLRLEV